VRRAFSVVWRPASAAFAASCGGLAYSSQVASRPAARPYPPTATAHSPADRTTSRGPARFLSRHSSACCTPSARGPPPGSSAHATAAMNANPTSRPAITGATPGSRCGSCLASAAFSASDLGAGGGTGSGFRRRSMASTARRTRANANPPTATHTPAPTSRWAA
jgi:hypothetical protein